MLLISTMCLGMNIGIFFFFFNLNLVFTHKRKFRNNTSRFNYNKPKKSARRNTYTRREEGFISLNFAKKKN